MDEIMDALAELVPVPPCPPWCELPAGHHWSGYDIEGPDRSHYLAVGGPVGLAQMEQALEAGVHREPVVVVVDPVEVEVLDAEGARALAAALLQAAALLDGLAA